VRIAPPTRKVVRKSIFTLLQAALPQGNQQINYFKHFSACMAYCRKIHKHLFSKTNTFTNTSSVPNGFWNLYPWFIL
jgi:hypothetical protein